MSVATVNIVGYLAADPDIRSTRGGTVVTGLRVATTRGFDRDEVTTWFGVVMFGDFWADKAEKAKWSKGDLMFIVGELSAEEWEDRDGNARTALKVYPSFIRRMKRAGGEDDDGDDRGSRRGRSGRTSRSGRSDRSSRSERRPSGRGRGDTREEEEEAQYSSTDDLSDEIPF